MNNLEYTINKNTRMFQIIIFIFILSIGMPLCISLIISAPIEQKWIPMLWIIIVLFSCFSYYKMPDKIILVSDSYLIFKKNKSEKILLIQDIISIETNINKFLLYFKHKKGKITVQYKFDNLQDLILRIKNINVNIRTKGC